MNLTSYLHDGKYYHVKKCNVQDIPSHVEKVLSYWKDVNLDRQIEVLTKCIDRGLSLKLVDDNDTTHACFYTKYIGSTSIKGYLLWFEYKHHLAMLGHYIRTKTNIQKIIYYPHALNTFSFITEHSNILDKPYYTILLYSDKVNKGMQVHYNQHEIKEVI